jgi:hypothetical protein
VGYPFSGAVACLSRASGGGRVQAGGGPAGEAVPQASMTRMPRAATTTDLCSPGAPTSALSSCMLEDRRITRSAP